jgi:hypothetical protein
VSAFSISVRRSCVSFCMMESRRDGTRRVEEEEGEEGEEGEEDEEEDEKEVEEAEEVDEEEDGFKVASL